MTIEDLNTKKQSSSYNSYFFILQLSCFAIFLGRAYQHLFWDGPYRSVLWDESLMSGFLQTVFGLSWAEFVESVDMDQRIQLGIKVIGCLLLLAAIGTLAIKKIKKPAFISIILGVILLVLLAFVTFKSKFFHVGEVFEFGIQIISPLILILIVKQKMDMSKILFFSKIAVAITFIGHGLYAFGFYPQPGNYVDMVITITGFSEDFTRSFLTTMGIIDFVVAIAIFRPFAISKYALLYCAAWGLLTAFARVVAGFNADFMLQTLHQWGFETTFRLAHGLIPLWVFLVERKRGLA